MLVGEQFVKEVYTSLIANQDAWKKTLLIITFDEFVGSFDHVTDELGAGVVTPPWGPDGQPPFKSPHQLRLRPARARVPTILVSPYVQKGRSSARPARCPTTTPRSSQRSSIGSARPTRSRTSVREPWRPRPSKACSTLDRPRTDETALAFLDTPHAIGDPVQYGDSFLLQNQSGVYPTGFYPTLKDIGGGFRVPDSVIGICVDLGLAAFFPTTDGARPAVLELRHPGSGFS